MLIIRSEQMAAFQPVADDAFVRRVVEHLLDKYPDVPVRLPENECLVKLIPEDTLHDMVRGGLERARSYGISQESGIVAFVIAMFLVAPSFDEHPLIRRVLLDADLPPNSRMDQVVDRTSDQNWEAARQNYNAAAWNLRLKGVQK